MVLARPEIGLAGLTQNELAEIAVVVSLFGGAGGRKIRCGPGFVRQLPKEPH
jgi:hypothetical protein